MKREISFKEFIDRDWNPDDMTKFLQDHGWSFVRNSKHIILEHIATKQRVAIPHGGNVGSLAKGYKRDIANAMWPDRHKKTED